MGMKDNIQTTFSRRNVAVSNRYVQTKEEQAQE
jgi:hypothetical protein